MSKFLMPAKPYPCNDRETTLTFVRESQPEAENDIVAVDLYSQDLYKKIQKDQQENRISPIDQYDEIEFYGYLKALRMDLINDEVNKFSSFKRKEAVNA